MSFFKQLFSSHYRRAVALEGAGKYKDAATQYALAGERADVARMHWLSARDEHDPYARVDSLRKALDFMDDPEDQESVLMLQAVRRKLADSQVELVEHNGLMDRRDRGLLEEAAGIYLAQQAHKEAGECYAKLGYLNKAAECFKTSGDIGRMEEMFQRVEAIDLSEAAYDRAWDAYEFARMAGDPVGAIEALARCVELRPQDASLLGRLESMRERIPRAGRITFSTGAGAPWVLVGGKNIGIGREDDNALLLRDPSVSRHHARLSFQSGELSLEDLGSAHGTFLGQERVERGVSIHQEDGELHIGKTVTVKFEFRPGMSPPALFEVVTGHLKGQRFTWAPRLRTHGIPPAQPSWMPPGLALDFKRDHWHLVPEQSDGPVRLNGKQVAVTTLLRSRDEIDFGGVTMRID